MASTSGQTLVASLLGFPPWASSLRLTLLFLFLKENSACFFDVAGFLDFCLVDLPATEASLGYSVLVAASLAFGRVDTLCYLHGDTSWVAHKSSGSCFHRPHSWARWLFPHLNHFIFHPAVSLTMSLNWKPKTLSIYLLLVRLAPPSWGLNGLCSFSHFVNSLTFI